MRWISTPATTILETTKLVDRLAIAITSGANLGIDEMWETGTIIDRTSIRTNRAIATSATATTRMQVLTSVEVRVLTTRNQNLTRETETRSAGPTATAITTRVMCSRATWTCREDASARSSAIEIVSTRCAAQNHERWQPSARFE